MLHVASNVHGQFVGWLYHSRIIRFGDVEELFSKYGEDRDYVIRDPRKLSGALQSSAAPRGRESQAAEEANGALRPGS